MPAARPDFTGMISAFTRILLALAMALTFAGQMEAAAAHCAQLVQHERIAAGDMADCHGMDNAVSKAGHHGGGRHGAPADTPKGPTADHCECIAALKVCAAPAGMPGSSRITPYAWLRVEDATFVSIEPAPALRPPRA